MSYDYTVLAGTQGLQNHRKKDRLFELAEQLRLPIVFFTEGGGGRPGDTDGIGVSGLDCLAFLLLRPSCPGSCRSSASTPGYCFAGNAAILGCCDVVIATEDSNIGMGGPAMIEGGGLGVFEPTAIGPIERAAGQRRRRHRRRRRGRGRRRRQAVPVVLPGPRRRTGTCADQALLRDVVPGRPAAQLRRAQGRSTLLFDTGSVLELRRDFGLGMITALARIEGRPVGVIANNPTHLAGAIDTPTAPTRRRGSCSCATRSTCPIVTLCDTPGMMVGPEVEATALVRHCSRLFVTGANLTVPMVTIVLRKAYGLGAQAMMGGIDEGAAGVPGVADRRVRRHGPRGRGAARLPQGARRPSTTPTSARRCSRSWSTGCTSTARRSASRRTSRSTTSSTRPTPAAGSPPCSTPPAATATRRQEAPEHRHLVTLRRVPSASDAAASAWPNIVIHCSLDDGLKT